MTYAFSISEGRPSRQRVQLDSEPGLLEAVDEFGSLVDFSSHCCDRIPGKSNLEWVVSAHRAQVERSW